MKIDDYDHLDEIVELPPLRAVILHVIPWRGDPKGDARHLDVLDEAGLHYLQLPRLHGWPGHQEASGRHRTWDMVSEILNCFVQGL